MPGKKIAVSTEAIGPYQPDLLQQIQRRCVNAFIQTEIAKMAEITGSKLAREFYRPTAFEGPA